MVFWKTALADDVAASCFDDHVNGQPGFELELVDCWGDHADDPCQTCYTDDGLGLGAVGNDGIDGAGELVRR